MTQPQVAVIGCGYWGQNLVRNFYALGALKVICDVGDAARARAAELCPEVEVNADFAAIIARSDISGVVIATPAETHQRLALEALRSGKDVLFEKPLALT